MQFSRTTVVALINALEKGLTVAEFDRMLLRYGLEDIAPASLGTKPKRLNALAEYLIDTPQATGPLGSPLVLELIEEEISRRRDSYAFGGSIEDALPELVNSLKKDGYAIQDGSLRTMLPQSVQLPKKEDELQSLLDRFQFDMAKGHLDQSIAAHTRGDWASANGQLRTFVESLFSSIAQVLAPQEVAQLGSSHQQREFLAKLTPPFLDPSLNEWELGDKGGFVQGFWRRLHPQGSHPGLSDEEDSTFRLHLVVLTMHHFLKRLDKRLDA